MKTHSNFQLQNSYLTPFYNFCLFTETLDSVKRHLPAFLLFFEHHWDSCVKPLSHLSSSPMSILPQVRYLLIFLLPEDALYLLVSLHDNFCRILDILNIMMCLEIRFSCLPGICWHSVWSGLSCLFTDFLNSSWKGFVMNATEVSVLLA